MLIVLAYVQEYKLKWQPSILLNIQTLNLINAMQLYSNQKYSLIGNTEIHRNSNKLSARK